MGSENKTKTFMPSIKTKSKLTHLDPKIKIKSLHSTLSWGITNDKWRLEHLSIVKLAQNQQHAIVILLSLRIVLFSRTAAVWQYVIKQIRYVMTRDSSRPKCLGGLASPLPPRPQHETATGYNVCYPFWEEVGREWSKERAGGHRY